MNDEVTVYILILVTHISRMPHLDERKGPLRIGFIHPDLGIGGAERLVVDAAVSLQQRGHEVVLFTSRHDPHRCFEETRDGECHSSGDCPVLYC